MYDICDEKYGVCGHSGLSWLFLDALDFILYNSYGNPVDIIYWKSLHVPQKGSV